MKTLAAVAIGVGISLTLRAADVPAQSDWGQHYDAASAALGDHNYAGAARMFDEAVTLSRTGAERAESLAGYGVALHFAERNAEARRVLEEVLASGDASDSDRAASTDVLSWVYHDLGDYVGAEKLLRSELARQSGTPADRERLTVTLADLLREQGRSVEAKAAIDSASKLAGLTWAQQSAILIERACIARDMRLWNSSLALWNQISDIADQNHSPELEAAVAGGLGETWFAAGNLDRAEPLLRRSLHLLQEDPSTSPLQIAKSLSSLTRLYTAENKLALAEETLSEAVALDEKNMGPDHPQVGALLELRATIMSQRGEAPAAREDLQRARDIMSAHFGPGSLAVAGVYAEWGDVEQRDGKPGAAVAQYSQAIALLSQSTDTDKNGNPNATLTPGLIARYAAALKATHHKEEAQLLLKKEAQLQPKNQVSPNHATPTGLY